MVRPAAIRVGKHVLGWGIAVLVLLLLVPRVRADWSTVRSTVAAPDWGLLAAGVAVSIGYFGLRAVAWNALARGFTPPASSRIGVRIWFLTEFSRYLPGNIWSFVGRAGAYRALGVPVARSGGALVREALGVVAAAGVVSGLLWSGVSHQSATVNSSTLVVAAFGGVAMIVLLLPLRFRGTVPKFSDRTAAQLALVGAWIAFGFGSALVLAAFGVSNVIGGAFASVLAWALGYLSLLTPSGLGVREAAFAWIATSVLGLPLGLASALALASRVVLTALEGILVVGVLAIVRRTPGSPI